MVKAKIFIPIRSFVGEIKEDDIILKEEELPPLQDNEILIETLYLSVDPYMRAYYKVGEVMVGTQVSKIIESKSSTFHVGAIVLSSAGWRTHTILSEDEQENLFVLPEFGDFTVSLALGVLGMPGNSAYFGFLDICKPKKGETVVVSGAGGAVGSHVGQIAKIKECTVIGITGTDEKVKWLKSIGFDRAINYKTADLEEALKEAAPNGIDCYFDNVGGDISSTVLYQMNRKGRISICGSISAYNATSLPKATIIQPAVLGKQLEMKGFVFTDYQNRWLEGIEQNLKWAKEGKLKYRETVTDGFENATRALIGIFKGENIGKAIVKVASSNVEAYAVNFKSLLKTFQKNGK